MAQADTVVLIYPASEAPNYRVGYKAAAAFCVACLLATGVFKYKDRQLRRKHDHVDLHREERTSHPDQTDAAESNKYN